MIAIYISAAFLIGLVLYLAISPADA